MGFALASIYTNEAIFTALRAGFILGLISFGRNRTAAECPSRLRLREACPERSRLPNCSIRPLRRPVDFEQRNLF